MIYDVLIIGGGPAGATAGTLLSRAGWSVAIIEKKMFPRLKVCGEFISATTLPLLTELGLADVYLDMGGPAINRVGLFVGKKSFSAPMPPANSVLSPWGRALGREHLDTLLLQQAKREGAAIFQPCQATKISCEDNLFKCELNAKIIQKPLLTKLVIIAQGSWERSVIDNNRQNHQVSDLLGFKAHFKNTLLPKDLMPMIVFPGGYGGLVHSDHDRVSLSCCIRRDTLHSVRKRYPGLQAGDAVLQYIFCFCQGVRDVLYSANQDSPWLSVGPLRPGIRKCYEKGIFFVGNATGEAHPIIAEGISMAMQSASLLARALITNNHNQDFTTIAAQYQYDWTKQFAGRLRAAALFAKLAMHPANAYLFRPILEFFPSLLTFGARLSGKTYHLNN